ncbi:MAG TPA: hypothetical protein VHZ09_19285 [Acidobacteriaceae bacterium]|jgi:hypothetical protein|nr:hypothetical protein [Acidobacteriaceae bacterium]
MSRVTATCPNGDDVDVLAATWDSKASIPSDWSLQVHCYLCGQTFTVTAENCSVIPSNNSGVIH